MTPTRKSLTLPSGATCVIRKLCGFDVLSLGHLPDALAGAATRAKEKPGGTPPPADIEALANFTRLAIVKCTSRLTLPGGAKRRIVDKELDEAGPDEITIGELSDPDASMLIQEINELSGLAGAAVEAARPFPEEQTGGGGASPGGAAVSQAAVGNPEPGPG